jgi:hypothetical protein
VATTEKTTTLVGTTESDDARGADAWIVRTDHNGSVSWTRQHDVGATDVLADVASTPDGVVTVGSVVPEGGGDSEGLVLGLDTTGNVRWRHTLGDAGNDELRAVIPTANGSAIAGSLFSPDTGTTDGWSLELSTEGTIGAQLRHETPTDESIIASAGTERQRVLAGALGDDARVISLSAEQSTGGTTGGDDGSSDDGGDDGGGGGAIGGSPLPPAPDDPPDDGEDSSDGTDDQPDTDESNETTGPPPSESGGNSTQNQTTGDDRETLEPNDRVSVPLWTVGVLVVLLLVPLVWRRR